MGSSQVKPGPHKVIDNYSLGVVVSDVKEKTVIILSPQTTNIVAILTTHYTPGYKYRDVKFDISVEVNYGAHARPVIGFFNKEHDLRVLWLEDDEHPDFSYWYISTGKLIVRGKEQSKLLPVCKPGGKININAHSTSVNLTVTNPGLKPEHTEFGLSDISLSSLPFVGATRTGRGKVTFELLLSDRVDSLPDSGFESMQTKFVDYTLSTKFSYFEGIINVSSDGKSLTRTSAQQGNGYALLNKIVDRGTHRFKLRVLIDYGASLCVGVARHPFKLSTEYIKDPMKHIYRHPGLLLWRSYRGLLYVDGKQLDKNTEALSWQQGNILLIELIINMEERTIELLKNDMSLGIIFTDIPEVVQPVLAYYAAYEKSVQLVSYEISESSLPIPKPRRSLPQKQSSTPIPSTAEFDPSTKSGLMSLSSDKKTVYREKNQSGNSLCMFNVVCDKNCFYRFSLIVENDQGASVCVGVTDVLDTKDIRLDGIGNIYSSSSLYVFRSFQGMLYNRGKELPKHLEEYWMTGTLLEMMIDIGETTATVQYAINGNDQGIAFSDIRPPVRPLVAFYAGMEKRITLIHFESKPKLSPIPIQRQASSNRFTGLVSLPSEQLSPKLQVHVSEHTPKLPQTLKLTEPTPEQIPKSIVMRMNSYSKCEICGRPVDCIALPCDHQMLCAKHLASREHCPCGAKILGTWNLF